MNNANCLDPAAHEIFHRRRLVDSAGGIAARHPFHGFHLRSQFPVVSDRCGTHKNRWRVGSRLRRVLRLRKRRERKPSESERSYRTPHESPIKKFHISGLCPVSAAISRGLFGLPDWQTNDGKPEVTTVVNRWDEKAGLRGRRIRQPAPDSTPQFRRNAAVFGHSSRPVDPRLQTAALSEFGPSLPLLYHGPTGMQQEKASPHSQLCMNRTQLPVWCVTSASYRVDDGSTWILPDCRAREYGSGHSSRASPGDLQAASCLQGLRLAGDRALSGFALEETSTR